MDTEWSGYSGWNNLETRLQQFRQSQGLNNRLGAFRGAIRFNEDNGVFCFSNIMHFDPVFCSADQGPPDSERPDMDHIFYLTQVTNFEIVSNWMGGHPNTPAGGLKHRNTNGPGVIAANYFHDTPLLMYAYTGDVYAFENQLIYRNYFKILTNESSFIRNGISYLPDDSNAPETNITIANNTYDCANGTSSVYISSKADASGFLVYNSNKYISGTTVEIASHTSLGYTSGTPPTSLTSSYDGYSVPFLNIPEYGEIPIIEVTGVTVSPISLSLEIGESSNLTETVSPSNATNKSVTWSSNNTSVATVNSNGLVTAQGEGNATITVKTNDGNKTATCAITVTTPGGGTVTLNPEDDAFVRGDSYADSNYGTSDVLDCKTGSSDKYTRQVYLKFDLSSVPGTVTNATLRLKAVSNSGSDTHNALFVSNDSWEESSITWNNKLAAVTTLDSKAAPSAGSWIELDVTNQVASELFGDQTISIALIANSAAYVKYYSKEASSSADYPQLVVEYTEVGTDLASFQNVGSTNYMSSEDEDLMACNKTNVGTTEKYEIVDAGGGLVAFKGSNGKYVSSENGTKIMTCNRTNIGLWEKFEMIDYGNDVYALKGNNGLHVRNNMLCTAANPGDWQKFKVTRGLKSGAKVEINRTEFTINNVTVFPNPANEILNVHIAGEIQGNLQVKFYNVTGKIILSKTLVAGTEIIDISGLKSGIYFVQVINGQQIYNNRIVKN
ncbi:DNRLRE domain-containing protein [Bacteroidales bacterium]|nr:DNRLRE domain-containing protein [Bacteroidales bacterium]